MLVRTSQQSHSSSAKANSPTNTTRIKNTKSKSMISDATSESSHDLVDSTWSINGNVEGGVGDSVRLHWTDICAVVHHGTKDAPQHKHEPQSQESWAGDLALRPLLSTTASIDPSVSKNCTPHSQVRKWKTGDFQLENFPCVKPRSRPRISPRLCSIDVS